MRKRLEISLLNSELELLQKEADKKRLSRKVMAELIIFNYLYPKQT